jgi:hypothetical protein
MDYLCHGPATVPPAVKPETCVPILWFLHLRHLSPFTVPSHDMSTRRPFAFPESPLEVGISVQEDL